MEVGLFFRQTEGILKHFNLEQTFGANMDKQHPSNSNTLYLAINALLGLLFMGLIALFLIDFFTHKPLLFDSELNSEVEQLALTPIQIEEVKPVKPIENTEEDKTLALESLADKKIRMALKHTLQTRFSLQEVRAENFSHWILNAHKQTQVPVGFIAALVAAESSFRYKVVSPVGAIGPAQVRPAHWQKFCNLDLNDPEQNILCGAKALRQLYESPACKENWSCAFSHYNVGRGNLLRNTFPGAAERYIKRIKSKLDMAPALWPKGLALDP